MENRPVRSRTGVSGFFEKVAASEFLCGRSVDFTADLEWLLRPENFLKTIEGRYDKRATEMDIVPMPTTLRHQKIAPQSTEAEQATLGGLMLDPTAWARVASRVMASDFFRADHRVIFDAIARMGGRAPRDRCRHRQRLP